MLFVLKTTYPIMRACADIRQEVWRVLDRLAAICQTTFPGLDTFVDIRQPTFPRLAKGLF